MIILLSRIIARWLDAIVRKIGRLLNLMKMAENQSGSCYLQNMLRQLNLPYRVVESCHWKRWWLFVIVSVVTNKYVDKNAIPQPSCLSLIVCYIFLIPSIFTKEIFAQKDKRHKTHICFPEKHHIIIVLLD